MLPDADITRERITQVNARYHDAIADNYDGRLEQNHPEVIEWYRRLFARYVLPRLATAGAPTCLDFGCGSGFLEQFVPNLHVTGIDVSEKMLCRAAQRYPDVQYLKADLYTFQSDDLFDLTMENAVLHHLLDYEALVEKMAASTRPGGVLFLGNEPNEYAYRYLRPLAQLFRRTANHRRTTQTRELLGDEQYEALAEYHLFYASGINPFRLRRRLRSLGFRKVWVFFSLRELFAALEEAFPWAKLNALMPGLVRDHCLFSRNFSIVAYK